MFGDLQYTNAATGGKFKGNTKVYKFKGGNSYHCDFIVGFSGTASDVVSIVSYFTSPESFKRPPKVGSIRGLVLTAEKDLFMFDEYNKWLAVNEPYTAVGSGCDYAIGAMACGLSPKEAVKIAMKHDAFTGMGVKGFSFD